MRRSPFIFVCVLLAAAPALRAADAWNGVAFQQDAPRGVAAWFVLPTQMVLDDADLPANPAGPAVPYRMSAARNESECVQLVLMLANAVDETRVEFGAFTNARGDAIPPESWRVNLVGQVPGRPAARAAAGIKSWDVPEPSASRRIPDPLLLDETFPLPRGLSRIWLTLRVPKDARPGDYRGVVRVRGGERIVIELPLDLRVWNHTLPDEPSLMVLANVSFNRPRHGGGGGGGGGGEGEGEAVMAAAADAPLWDHLRPIYDDLKAHRVSATGEIYPLRAWRRDGPPPAELDDYERALKHVLDDLGFARFRFPGIAGAAAAAPRWNDLPVLDDRAGKQTVDGTWIDGMTPTRQSGVGNSAKLAGYAEEWSAWAEYEFEVNSDDQLFAWLQIDPRRRGARRVISIDGEDVGMLAGDAAAHEPLGFVPLPRALDLKPGKHRLRITMEEMAGPAEPIYGVFLSPDPNPDFERLLRDRAKLDGRFRDAFHYHAQQHGDWLRQRGWLKKAQARPAEESGVASFGRVAAVYDFLGEALPSIRREIGDAPAAPLRRSVELWTPPVTGVTLDDDGDGALAPIEPGDELWTHHDALHTLGYPSVSMRMIPWILGRHGIKGYVFRSVNAWPADPWKYTQQDGAFMRHTLIYPDPRTGRPVDSVRWELFREGLEDFETLRLLRTAVDEAGAAGGARPPDRAAVIAEAETLLSDGVKGLVGDAQDFSWDAAELERLRTRAGELLDALTPP